MPWLRRGRASDLPNYLAANANVPKRPCGGASRKKRALCNYGRINSIHISPASMLCSRSSLRSEEHTSELQSLMRISYAVFCLKNKKLGAALLIRVVRIYNFILNIKADLQYYNR